MGADVGLLSVIFVLLLLVFRRLVDGGGLGPLLDHCLLEFLFNLPFRLI